MRKCPNGHFSAEDKQIMGAPSGRPPGYPNFGDVLDGSVYPYLRVLAHYRTRAPLPRHRYQHPSRSGLSSSSPGWVVLVPGVGTGHRHYPLLDRRARRGIAHLHVQSQGLHSAGLPAAVYIPACAPVAAEAPARNNVASLAEKARHLLHPSLIPRRASQTGSAGDTLQHPEVAHRDSTPDRRCARERARDSRLGPWAGGCDGLVVERPCASHAECAQDHGCGLCRAHARVHGARDPTRGRGRFRARVAGGRRGHLGLRRGLGSSVGGGRG